MSATPSPEPASGPAPDADGDALPTSAGAPASEAEAIFVVGVSRSGTTLLRRLLETSERVAIAPENHFVGHLIEREGARHYFRRFGDLTDDSTPREITRFIYSGEFQRRSRFRQLSPYWRWLVKSVPQADMERRLLAAERTERGMLAAFMRAYADQLQRPVMGEKTPAHLNYVETLLEWFPSGRVLHIIRDPRAIYVSDLRRRRQRPSVPYSLFMRLPLALEAAILFQTTLAWAAAARRHRRLERRFAGSYLLLRFEDLVTQPEVEIPRLFGFLGLPVPENATDVTVVSRGFRLGEAGFDAGAADRWRKHLHPFGARALKLFLGRSMRRLGYGD